jgi:hypothetical protein
VPFATRSAIRPIRLRMASSRSWISTPIRFGIRQAQTRETTASAM